MPRGINHRLPIDLTPVVIPAELRDKLLKSARELHDAKIDGRPCEIDHLESWATGALDILRCEYPSETVGLLICDYDRVVEGGDENP